MAAGDGGRALGVAMSNPTLDGFAVGSVIGADAGTAKLGFYGNASAPIVRPAATNQAAAASTAAVSVSATQWGFGTSTQANSLINLVLQLREDLVALGLIKGSI